MGKFVNKVFYGSFFVIILPIFLHYWALYMDRYVDLSFPLNNYNHNIPLFVVFVGILVLSIGMITLMKKGEGLPMNAYPPKYFVSQGIYYFFSHPIYLGAVISCFGYFSFIKSATGIYLVSPIFLMMVIALVYGYEDRLIHHTYKDSARNFTSLFALPNVQGKSVTLLKKLAMILRVLLPLYFVSYIWGVIDLTKSSILIIHIVYAIFSIFVVFFAKDSTKLRSSMLNLTISSVVLLYINLLLSRINLDIYSSAVIALGLIIFDLSIGVIWSKLRFISEKIANNRHDYLFFEGQFRIISHARYSFLSGAVASIFFFLLTGNSSASFIILFLAMTSAAIFAQKLWGSKKLLRPFGYYGGVIGSIVAVLCCHFVFGMDFGIIAIGAVITGPFCQAISRFRCLEQGCCHGLETNSRDLGIIVTNRQSRVCLNSGLSGKLILPTQMFSIIFNVCLGIFLAYLFLNSILSSNIIIALYFILTGLERFVEDAYRGEVQTRKFFDLKEPQLFALVCLVIGIVLTFIPLEIRAPVLYTLNFSAYFWAILSGLYLSFIMSMDFPKSDFRYSRLSG